MIICGNCGQPAHRPAHAKWCKTCAKLKDRESHQKCDTEQRKKFERYKVSIGCQKCGYNKCPDALDFHHKNPSEKERRVSRTFHTELAQKEIDKCVLLCKNCHYEEHYEQRKIGKDDRP